MQVVVLAVFDYTDNLAVWPYASSEAEPAAYRVLAGPKVLGQGLIDDHHPRRSLSVMLIEVASLQNRDAQGLEVFDPNNIRVDRAPFVRLGNLLLNCDNRSHK